MTALLIDTHVFVWLKAARTRLRASALEAIADPRSKVLFSAASAAELFDKFSKGGDTGVNRLLAEGEPSFMESLSESGIEPIEVTHSHAAAIGLLPPHHRDPVDRLLIAQAISERLTLISNDRAFERYEGLSLLKA